MSFVHDPSYNVTQNQPVSVAISSVPFFVPVTIVVVLSWRGGGGIAVHQHAA